LDYLERVEEFEEQSARAQVAYQLNRWLESQEFDSDWKPDAMVSRLPRVVRERGVLDDLPKRLFTDEDVRALQEGVWMRQLAQWIARQPLDPLFGRWLERSRSRLGAEAADQLGMAYRFFDWIIRNIQLDELLPSPDESTAAPAAGVGDAAAVAEAPVPAALRGIPGPGYSLEPSRNLLFGHGDAWQRMRLFTLLARQQGIDAVTLAFPGRTIPPRPRPWTSAVRLGKDLYLFDLRLGLAIPTKEWEGVVTLRDVLADRSLIKNLEADGQPGLQIPEEDLAEVVALIDVVGPQLAHRTQLVEKHLVGEHRTVLSVPISKLAASLRACHGIRDVYLWSVPIEANWYRAVFEQKARSDPQAVAQYYLENSMFLTRTPLVRGRIVFLRGEFDNRDERQGAKALLMQTRVPQDQLDDLATNGELQKLMGVARDPRSTPEQWAAQVEMYKGVLTRTKQHASFWMGLCQLESGRPDAAIEWFQTRTLEAWPDGPWTPLARYNLARTHEALGDLAQAQKLLLADKSLQEQGNYLRARMLEKHLATALPKNPNAKH
jgi:hypothetical protein